MRAGVRNLLQRTYEWNDKRSKKMKQWIIDQLINAGLLVGLLVIAGATEWIVFYILGVD